MLHSSEFTMRNQKKNGRLSSRTTSEPLVLEYEVLAYASMVSYTDIGGQVQTKFLSP